MKARPAAGPAFTFVPVADRARPSAARLDGNAFVRAQEAVALGGEAVVVGEGRLHV